MTRVFLRHRHIVLALLAGLFALVGLVVAAGAWSAPLVRLTSWPATTTTTAVANHDYDHPFTFVQGAERSALRAGGVSRGLGAMSPRRPAGVAAEELTTALADAARSCSVNSFTANTPVLLANGTEEPISKVRIGDKVLATDPETGKTEARWVTKLIVHSGEHTMVEVTMADGSKLTATDRHDPRRMEREWTV